MVKNANGTGKQNYASVTRLAFDEEEEEFDFEQAVKLHVAPSQPANIISQRAYRLVTPVEAAPVLRREEMLNSQKPSTQMSSDSAGAQPLGTETQPIL